MKKMTKRQALLPSKKKFWGQVLWFDHRDGYGIIKDWDGNRLYFSSDVITLPEHLPKMQSGRFVTFNINQRIEHCLCACYVAAPDYPIEKEKKK